jgi:hypothetical protein
MADGDIKFTKRTSALKDWYTDRQPCEFMSFEGDCTVGGGDDKKV